MEDSEDEGAPLYELLEMRGFVTPRRRAYRSMSAPAPLSMGYGLDGGGVSSYLKIGDKVALYSESDDDKTTGFVSTLGYVIDIMMVCTAVQWNPSMLREREMYHIGSIAQSGSFLMVEQFSKIFDKSIGTIICTVCVCMAHMYRHACLKCACSSLFFFLQKFSYMLNLCLAFTLS